MDKELLKKYINNCYNDEEMSSILAWFENVAEKPESKDMLLKIWNEIPDTPPEDYNINFDHILNTIHHQLNLKKSKILLEKTDHNVIRFKRREFMIRIISSAAMILFLPVFTFGMYMFYKFNSVKNDQLFANQSYNEIFSSVDAITKVTLPDGTNVWLNHGSILKYPASFTGSSRTVELKGEGFFEVTRNSKIPFIVKAGDLRIVALGTTFNVLAYPEGNRIETSLIDGEVELEKLNPNGNIIQHIKMNPEDRVIINKGENRINKQIIQDDRYFSWKEGKLLFRNESTELVVERLERWFNVNINIEDPALLDLTFTGTFIHETLPEVLELLVKVSPISYTISTREKMSDGTFSRREVNLYHRKN